MQVNGNSLHANLCGNIQTWEICLYILLDSYEPNSNLNDYGNILLKFLIDVLKVYASFLALYVVWARTHKAAALLTVYLVGIVFDATTKYRSVQYFIRDRIRTKYRINEGYGHGVRINNAKNNIYYMYICICRYICIPKFFVLRENPACCATFLFPFWSERREFTWKYLLLEKCWNWVYLNYFWIWYIYKIAQVFREFNICYSHVPTGDNQINSVHRN